MKIRVMCGERWYRRHSWKIYPLFWSLSKKTNGEAWGFGIGPILIWDGS
jgi:hypothetical protein